MPYVHEIGPSTRVVGNTIETYSAGGRPSGPSPRVGNHVDVAMKQFTMGPSAPARMPSSLGIDSGRAVHQRTRAKNIRRHHRRTLVRGSIPRSRAMRQRCGVQHDLADHPRAREGCGTPANFVGSRSGPSTRTRERHDLRDLERDLRWSILAHAEEKSGGRVESAASGHILARGRRSSAPLMSDSVTGPSPRVRVIRSARSSMRVVHRVIPARAGDTEIPRLSRVGRAVHPRRRRAVQNVFVLGNAKRPAVNPRMRMGESVKLLPRACRSGTSPRAGGEARFDSWRVRDAGPSTGAGDRSRSLTSDLHLGPSPHVLGILRSPCSRHNRTGSIPARAGDTRRVPRVCHSRRVHPRAGGGRSET